ncbi:hypothetical protein ACP4OV_008387 [Aristida adscensionis]
MSAWPSMDAVNLDDGWELLPDHKSSSSMEECSNGHGAAGSGKDQLLLSTKLVMINMDHFPSTSPPPPCDCIPDEEAKKPLLVLPPLQHDPDSKFKDIGVVPVPPEEPMPKVTEILISDAEGEEETIKSPAGAKDFDQDDEVLVEAAPEQPDGHCAQEQDEGIKRIGFSLGDLRVSGVGALCSFGVAAATFCIFLLGGNQQQQKRQKQNHRKIQLQMCADDERIQQVVQQASRLNQTMSSVMGGASSTRASISFGGHYHGF